MPHTVFGRVIGNGMDVVDAINNTPVFDVRSLVSGTGAGALGEVPLVNYTAGTVPTADNYIRINNVTEILTPPGTENTFGVFENSAVGESVGRVTASVPNAGIFEIDDTTIDDDLHLLPDDHLEGDPTAPVVLIEYLSLQCPACADAHPEVEQLLQDNPDDLLVVRRHLPGDTSNGGGFEHSFEAAIAAEAAGRQGMFDEMVDQLFSRQSEWTNSVSSADAQMVFDDIALNHTGSQSDSVHQ